MKQSLVQFIKFGIVGGINTVLSYEIYFLVIKLGGHYAVANFVAFVITVFISYILNGNFVFDYENKDKSDKRKIKIDLKSLVKVYASYSITSLFLATLLLWIEVDIIGLPEEIGPIINLFITVPVNFILNKFWAYRKKDEIKTNEEN